MEVIIIDSISHEWEAKGGILNLHSNMMGNSFTNWNKLTPRHNAFTHSLLVSPAHIIATIRSKQDYVLNEKNGKFVPEKVGLKGVTREGMDYEFTVVLDLDIKHNAHATKDRTGLFMNKPEFLITSDTGKTIRDWCNTGTSLKEVMAKINQSSDLEELMKIYLQYPEYQELARVAFSKQKQQITSKQKSNSQSDLKFRDNGTNSRK